MPPPEWTLKTLKINKRIKLKNLKDQVYLLSRNVIQHKNIRTINLRKETKHIFLIKTSTQTERVESQTLKIGARICKSVTVQWFGFIKEETN